MGNSVASIIRVKDLGLNHYTSIFEYLGMESTNETSQSSVELTARTQFQRGISLRACVAKAVRWTLPEIKEVKTT